MYSKNRAFRKIYGNEPYKSRYTCIVPIKYALIRCESTTNKYMLRIAAMPEGSFNLKPSSFISPALALIYKVCFEATHP